MSEVKLQTGAFYARRYFLSACMNWNDCSYIKTDPTKANNWKKSVAGKIRIHPQSWNIELSGQKPIEKSEISAFRRGELKDGETRIPYIAIICKGENLALTGMAQFLELFECGLNYLFEKDPGNDAVRQKTEEFEEMAKQAVTFLEGVGTEKFPEVPAPPPDLNFA